MIQARTQSEWLKHYLQDHGGVMNVTIRTVIVG
jgi:hypothetical protein